MMEDQGSKSSAFQLASGDSPDPETSSAAGTAAERARAYLIAAPPDLLAATQAALDAMDEFQDSGTIEAATLLRAAIAKATLPPADGEAG